MIKSTNYALITIASLTLLGCAKSVDSGGGMIDGTIHSGLNRVKVGMTADEVGTIIGAHQNEGFDASSSDSSCRSYVYDETIGAKYAHVFYENGRVAQASEGHKGLCGFAPDVQ